MTTVLLSRQQGLLPFIKSSFHHLLDPASETLPPGRCCKSKQPCYYSNKGCSSSAIFFSKEVVVKAGDFSFI